MANASRISPLCTTGIVGGFCFMHRNLLVICDKNIQVLQQPYSMLVYLNFQGGIAHIAISFLLPVVFTVLVKNCGCIFI